MSAPPWHLNNHRFDEVLSKPFVLDERMQAARSLTAGRCQSGSYYDPDIPEDSAKPRIST
jgi:hypothetical protein